MTRVPRIARRSRLPKPVRLEGSDPNAVTATQPPAKRSRTLDQNTVDDDAEWENFEDIDWPDDRESVVDLDDLEARIQAVQNMNTNDEVEIKTELPLTIDLAELQMTDQYQNAEILGGKQETIVPTIEFDDAIDEEIEPPSPAPTIDHMPPPLSRQPAPQDNSEPLPQARVTDEDPDLFVLAIGLWCEEVGISRSQYSSLREILRMLEPHKILQRLPNGYAALRRRTRGWLPQMQLRRALLPLHAPKLPSVPEKKKRRRTPPPPKEHLYFFDPLDLFEKILLSTLAKRMYFGFGEFRTHPTELWHSRAWTSSVRTTSGQFARYRNGSPIFPSDWVIFKIPASDIEHLGRVVEVGLDFRDDAQEPGKVKLKIQRALWQTEMSSTFPFQQFGVNEVMLRADFIFLNEDAVISQQTNVAMEYQNKSLPEPVSHDHLICRSVWNADNFLQPLTWTAPHRGELELKMYGRQYFMDEFDSAKGNCLSLPYLLFLDGFGLYRNAYRSLMGVYLFLAPLTFHERMRRVNVFPLTLGPHGSNLDDVLDALTSLRSLDQGVTFHLPQPTKVCIFPLCTVGDMPAQQKNGGFKAQNATLGCRFCLIPSDERDNLDYDVVKNGRFHYETMDRRRKIKRLGVTAKEKEENKWGILSEEPALFRLFPALDIIVTRPGDPAHSEYAGLCKQLHQLLLSAVLTPGACQSYAAAIRVWPFAPGFARIQSPIHHLKSYSLSEHARWIVVVPGLLRCWLNDNHLQPYFKKAIKEHLKADLGNRFTATETIVRIFASVARSTSMLMTDNLRSRDQLITAVKRARGGFQDLLSIAASAANYNPRSRSATPVRSTTPSQNNLRWPGEGVMEIPSRANTPLGAPPRDVLKAQEYLNDRRRPNVHTAIHYGQTMEEFAIPSNINVLIGEDKHRLFKQLVYQTNHINVEKLLLSSENLRQSIRLILLGAWKGIEPQATAVVKELYSKCPLLFDTLVSKSERSILRLSLQDPDGEEDELALQSDGLHKRVTAIGRLQPKYCKEVLRLPIRASSVFMTHSFKSQLRSAFTTDYNMPNVIYFGPHAFQWCRKVGFSSGNADRRFSFGLGDFIKFHKHRIGCIEGLLVVRLSLSTNPQLFFKLVVAQQMNTLDSILEVPKFQITLDRCIVGLPGIEIFRPYLIPVHNEGNVLSLRRSDNDTDRLTAGGELLMIPWDVQYL
ncbi:MAG: hypothetical protein Q9180_004684 [Flavoplaca navasiana]